MREQQLHVSYSNSLHCIEVARVRIFVVTYQLVEYQSVNILSSKGMEYLREILNVDCPSLEYHSFVYAW